MPARAAVTVEARTVHLRSWRYEVRGTGGFRVPVYFLDADLPENSDGTERSLTFEASGTSGMKAALNGVPSLSVLDGWWIEGQIEGVTGWPIEDDGRGMEESGDCSKDASSLYDKLEQVIIPLFYHDRDRFIAVMRHSIALLGSLFNTHRML